MSGATSTLPVDVLIDSAVLYADVDGVSTKWGASRGGLRFEPGTTLRNIEYDGKRSPKANLDRITFRNPKITGTFIQFAGTLADRVEPGATNSFANSTRRYTPMDASTQFTTNDYLRHVKLTYRRGNGGTFSYVFPYAIVTEYSVQGQDNNEAEVQVTIEARNGPDVDDDASPFYTELTGDDILAAS